MNGAVAPYQQFVTVHRLDYANASTRPLAAYYAVKSHPVVLVIDDTGAVVERWIGVPDAEELATVLAQMVVSNQVP